MSILIDQLLRDSVNTMAEVDGKWYIAKSLEYPSLFHRLKEAFRVIRGKSRTYHYKQDEKVKRRKCKPQGWEKYLAKELEKGHMI